MQTLRLFYALWPDATLANALAGWAEQARPATGGRIMRTESLHLTLAFLGNIDIESAEELIEAPPVHRLQPGTLTLDQYGVFHRQRILWAGPSRIPDALQAAHDGLWLWLSGYGVQPPAQPFRPHVTLLRDADPAKAPETGPEPLTWHYDRMVLVASESRQDGSRYRVVAQSRPQPPTAA